MRHLRTSAASPRRAARSAQLKAALRKAGVVVEDLAGDVETAEEWVPVQHPVPPTLVQGDQINVPGSQGFINQPSAPITQHFNTVLTSRPPIDQAAAQQLLDTLPLDSVPAPTSLPSGSRMLLNPTPLFVGRAEDFKALAALKHGTTTVIAAATGMGGIGKTQLASEFVHRYGQYFAGGALCPRRTDTALVAARHARSCALAQR